MSLYSIDYTVWLFPMQLIKLNVRKLTEKYSMRAVLSSAFSLGFFSKWLFERALPLDLESPCWKYFLDASNPKEMEEAGKHGLAILGGETPLWKLICLRFIFKVIIWRKLSDLPISNKNTVYHNLKISQSLIPESIRFFFNMTIYPNKTDKWLRNLFEMLLNDSDKVRDPWNRPRTTCSFWPYVDLL